MTISIGTQWLNDYASALQRADSQKIAQLFHPGLAYIVNDKLHAGSASFCDPATWQSIFTKIEFRSAKAYNMMEVYPGHITYHEVLKIRIKFSDEELEGHFGDQSVVNSDGKMLLINRVADPVYFSKFTSALTNNS
jgi:hypothetical protein